MMNVMKRAWEIYRTLTGDHIAKISTALRMAWAEIKNTAKETFCGFAKIAKNDRASDDCDYITFKLWEKASKRRVYLNDYKRRTIGYIDAITKEIVICDNQGNTNNEINTVISRFNSKYAF